MDIPAIETHYIANRGKYVKRMYFRSGNPFAAEDIVQSAYEHAIMYRAAYNPAYNYEAWFSTILNNCLRDYQNSERGYVPINDEDEETTEDTSCPHFPQQMMREILARIYIKQGVQKEVLILHFEKEYTAMDISRLTPYTFNAVRHIIIRFRNELKELYE